MCSTSLKQSIENRDLVAVRSLVEEGGEDIRLLFLDGSSPLGVAIANQREDVAAFLLDAGANPVAADSFRLDGCERQPVHYASSSGMLPVLKASPFAYCHVVALSYYANFPWYSICLLLHVHD